MPVCFPGSKCTVESDDKDFLPVQRRKKANVQKGSKVALLSAPRDATRWLPIPIIEQSAL